MGKTAVKPSIERDNEEQRLSRQEYLDFVESLPADRQEAHLRTLLVWMAGDAVGRKGDNSLPF